MNSSHSGLPAVQYTSESPWVARYLQLWYRQCLYRQYLWYRQSLSILVVLLLAFLPDSALYPLCLHPSTQGPTGVGGKGEKTHREATKMIKRHVTLCILEGLHD